MAVVSETNDNYITFFSTKESIPQAMPGTGVAIPESMFAYDGDTGRLYMRRGKEWIEQ